MSEDTIAEWRSGGAFFRLRHITWDAGHEVVAVEKRWSMSQDWYVVVSEPL